MITRLQGTLLEADLTEVVVDVHGVGYAVMVPMSTYDRLPRINDNVTLHTHFSVREDAMQLFGFATADERKLFRLLISVSGIGPRLALNVLSCMPASHFCRAVAERDIKALSKVNGIGKKVAERLAVELKDKVEEFSPEAALGTQSPSRENKEAQDAINALETLGYKSEQARKAVDKVCQKEGGSGTAENLIRKALQLLNS